MGSRQVGMPRRPRELPEAFALVCVHLVFLSPFFFFHLSFFPPLKYFDSGGLGRAAVKEVGESHPEKGLSHESQEFQFQPTYQHF